MPLIRRQGSPAYTAIGFPRFMDRLMMHGLEWLGLYYSTYRAEVVDNTGFESEAREKLGLLKVRVPAIGDTKDTPPRIAFPEVPFAGKGFGFKNIPPKGSFTYVKFENGRLDVPLWQGGWWLKGDMPKDLESVDAFGWFTPGGHQVLLDDTAGQETLRIKHLNGAVYEVDRFGNVTVSNSEPEGLPTKVFIGLKADEAAVRGDTLKSLLDDLFDELGKLTVGTGTGPSTPPLNSVQLAAIKARLSAFLSKTVVLK